METPAGVAPGRKGVGHAGLKKSAVQGNGTVTNQKRKPPMKTKSSRFDSLVARYYPAVYSFASRLTDDPREAVALTRYAFKNTQKQLRNRRDETALATILISAVIRAGLTAA
jgi:DNA-directed RNA polymerase specialized sigma24 family protein